jgi:predicted small secreted protein
MAMLKKLVALLLALSFVPGLALLGGCNTVQGAGQDISKAGGKVQEEAQEHKKY